MIEGWFKAWRKLEFSDVFDDAELLRLFVWCMIRANIDEGKLRSGLVLQRGQLVVSYDWLAARFKCPKSTIGRRFKRLEKMEMVQLSPQPTGTIVTVVHFSTYQDAIDDDATIGATMTLPSRNPDATLTQPEREEHINRRTEESNMGENAHQSSLFVTEDDENTPETPSTTGGKRTSHTYSTEFQKFWAAFPSHRRRKKPQTRNAYQIAVRRLCESFDSEEAVHPYLERRALEYAQSDEGTGQYARTPLPWIHQEAWADEPEAWKDSDNGQKGYKPRKSSARYGG